MNNQHESTLVRKKQIITAVRSLIIKQGSEHVTVRKIAQEVGVTEGALYRHFTSKREILSFLLDDIGKSLMSDLSGASNNNHNSLDTLEAILMYYVLDIKKKRGIPFQVIAEIISLGDAELNRQAYQVIQIFINRINQIVSNGIKAGIIKSNIDPDSVSILLFGMIQGLVTIWTLSYYKIDLQQKYLDLWGIFRQSITQNQFSFS
jgi:TetR/AcrR family transcriptional regulator